MTRAPSSSGPVGRLGRAALDYAWPRELLGMNENFSLIVMCIFLLGSLAFLAEQLTSYH
jgi:hypothetical protein